eukprot:TRINITY_DN2474_c0_g1_i1.p1 TRINITY_DN2474_c0_g1~~TRINITY_DN2474_c0_g1_i1.p1  ORF type:complete len:386 (+),score=129.76 TRINITY_DN2474_c0_g1_i1:130-1158(+)
MSLVDSDEPLVVDEDQTDEDNERLEEKGEEGEQDEAELGDKKGAGNQEMEQGANDQGDQDEDDDDENEDDEEEQKNGQEPPEEPQLPEVQKVKDSENEINKKEETRLMTLKPKTGPNITLQTKLRKLQPQLPASSPYFENKNKDQEKKDPQTDKSLKEILQLRTRVQQLAKENTQLKSLKQEQELKLEKQRLLLVKYRKRFVKAFEEGDGSPSDLEWSDDDTKKPSVSISTSLITTPNGNNDPDTRSKRKTEATPVVLSKVQKKQKKFTRTTVWTDEEEKIFAQAFTTYGKRWKFFCPSLPGKTRGQIQSHGKYLLQIGKLVAPSVIAVDENESDPDVDGDQ